MKQNKEFDPEFMKQVEKFYLEVCEELVRNPNWGNEIKEILDNFKKKDVLAASNSGPAFDEAKNLPANCD